MSPWLNQKNLDLDFFSSFMWLLFVTILRNLQEYWPDIPNR